MATSAWWPEAIKSTGWQQAAERAQNGATRYVAQRGCPMAYMLWVVRLL